jgi:hypothetical protein
MLLRDSRGNGTHPPMRRFEFSQSVNCLTRQPIACGALGLGISITPYFDNVSEMII